MGSARRCLILVLCVLLSFMPATAMATDGPEPSERTETDITVGTDSGENLPELSEKNEDTTTEATTEETAEGEVMGETSAESENADAAPAAEPEAKEDPNTIKIVMNGERIPFVSDPVNIDGTIYVTVKNFCEFMGCTVDWEAGAQAAHVTYPGELDMRVWPGSKTAYANDRYFYMSDICRRIDNSVMVPVRALAKIFTCEVTWDAAAKTVNLTGGEFLETAEEFYDSDDLYWLARIIHAESRGEPLRGKIAVGNVVLNRVESKIFPNTIYKVIFDRKSGVQFTPTVNGAIYNNPSQECVLAAKLCLEGHEEIASGALYFVSSRLTRCWVARNRAFIETIGGHSFYY